MTGQSRDDDEPPADRFDAVIFDLDGTLTTYEQDGAEILPQAFERADVEPFCTYAELEAVASEQASPADRTHASFWIAAFGRAAERHGGDPDDARALYEAFGAVLARERVRLLPGAEAALRAASERARVGLVTNGERRVQTAKLSNLGIADAFETAVYVDEVAAPKPATEPFRVALDDLGVAASEALYVGDSFYHDVTGAAAAGLHVAWCPSEDATGRAPSDGRNGDDVEPDYTVESLHELPALLD